MLWVIPIAVVSFSAVVFGTTLLKSADLLGGAAFGGVVGGALGLAFGISAKAALSGVAYRVSEGTPPKSHGEA
jgi:hypothetical protein